MISMIFKMSSVTMIYVGCTFIVYRQLKGKKPEGNIRIWIGVLYGVLAVLSTHFGIDYGHMMLNIRDLGPMTAGIFFDPVSGIIAGLIGGIERYIAGTFFSVGSYTRIACSISTCLAGFLAAFLNRYIFHGRKPSAAYSFFLGAVIEVFHMYVVFTTHRDDMEMAFHVVKTCSIPMIVFTGIGLALTSVVIRYCSGEWTNPFAHKPGEKVSVSQRFQVWLFGVTAIVLVMNFLFNYYIQTRAVIEDAHKDMLQASEEISDTYREVRGRGSHVEHLRFYVMDEGEFYITGKDGKIIAATRTGDEVQDEIIDLISSHGYDDFFDAEAGDKSWICRRNVIDESADLLMRVPSGNVFMSRDAQAYETMLGDILLFTVIYALISLLVQKMVIDNLLLVNKSLNRITEGDLNEKVKVYNSSEFASLSDDINLTVDALKGYINAAEKRMEEELLLAHTIQVSALPRNFDFNHRGFKVFATMDPAKEVGGDFYDFFFTDIDKVALVIADVSGKGIPAALFMMHSKTAIRSLAETGSQPAEVLSRVNNELCENNDASMFVTVWMGLADLKTGVVKCVNAGHEYPVLQRGGGDFELFKEKHGLPLGAMEGIKYREYEIKLDPGDRLYVYTDGVPEAINKEETQYGTDRMLSALNEDKDRTLEELLTAVKRDIDRFADGADQFDDITMLGFRYNGNVSKDS